MNENKKNRAHDISVHTSDNGLINLHHDKINKAHVEYIKRRLNELNLSSKQRSDVVSHIMLRIK